MNNSIFLLASISGGFPLQLLIIRKKKKKQLRLVLVRTGRREYFRAKYLTVSQRFRCNQRNAVANLAISAAFFLGKAAAFLSIF